MKTRFALALVALLPILVACQAKDGSENTTAPATPAATEAPITDPASIKPETSAASGETAAAEQAAAEAGAQTPAETGPAPAATAPVGPAPVEGTDYIVLKAGAPFAPATGKIEVAEIFGFVCPACNAFQPMVGPWKAGLPSDVNFVYVPAMFGGTWDTYGRAFFAAQNLGVEEKTHDALYAAIHVNNELKGERGRDTPEDIANFYAKHGVDAKKFVSEMNGFSVSGQINKAKQFAQRSEITGTPSIVVNGKYLVKGKGFADTLRVADHLIARERAAKAN
ncbi:thiol:disulfide interchange protein DsbA/DsbL [Stenotrophomonas sp. 278]|uniref:thiol:disulfide interchange protein DsbA/DsbL n=1 Tax=Stenotrophomonas sp. 278 TaxID=2479851 RepID=UPI000F69176F|nr:thiol:disulfide interchange protein DsbA/DsbL [Stenotrophomonas sp. 278]RRU14843.1 thiol:disulfide interchange protein DsbA/DsbL [Stenotrophomonas sp. 278]